MRRLFFTLCLLSGLSSVAREIPADSLRHAAEMFMFHHSQRMEIVADIPLVKENNEVAGHLFLFRPAGFVVTAGTTAVSPVYAWSADQSMDLSTLQAREWKEIVVHDLQLRAEGYRYLSAGERTRIGRQWREFLSGGGRSPSFEQWPPEGTTYTGGWLETNWTQSAPYNNMCPVDLNTGNRSVAGCPATAMAQMINYHRGINGTRFGDADDYYHSYGSGNSYWIDDDYQSRDFPCFDTLNYWLDSLEVSWEYGLNNPLKAALTFACGVAARQVYSSSVSGTFGLEQAIMAWQRFGFEESRLVYPDDTTLNTLIAENIKAALPVQLGLLVEGGSGGHNVVVDGYNTDEFYHFNFGWGGSANGWYTLPPTSIPYNLTIIEGAVADVKSALYTGVPGDRNPECYPSFYPNPVQDIVTLQGISGRFLVKICDLAGSTVLEADLSGENIALNLCHLKPGFYVYRIFGGDNRIVSGTLIKQ